MFTRKQLQRQIFEFESAMKKYFKTSVKTWDEVIKTAFNVAAPFIVMAVAAETKNPQSTKTTTNNF